MSLLGSPVGYWQKFDSSSPPPDGDYLVWCCETAWTEAGYEEARSFVGKWHAIAPGERTDHEFHESVTHYAEVLAP